jgi:hypothetical protein
MEKAEEGHDLSLAYLQEARSPSIKISPTLRRDARFRRKVINLFLLPERSSVRAESSDRGAKERLGNMATLLNEMLLQMVT